MEGARSIAIQWWYPVSNIIGAKQLWQWFFPRKAPRVELVTVSRYKILDSRSLTLLEILRIS